MSLGVWLLSRELWPLEGGLATLPGSIMHMVTAPLSSRPWKVELMTVGWWVVSNPFTDMDWVQGMGCPD